MILIKKWKVWLNVHWLEGVLTDIRTIRSIGLVRCWLYIFKYTPNCLQIAYFWCWGMVSSEILRVVFYETLGVEFLNFKDVSRLFGIVFWLYFFFNRNNEICLRLVRLFLKKLFF